MPKKFEFHYSVSGLGSLDSLIQLGTVREVVNRPRNRSSVKIIISLEDGSHHTDWWNEKIVSHAGDLERTWRLSL